MKRCWKKKVIEHWKTKKERTKKKWESAKKKVKRTWKLIKDTEKRIWEARREIWEILGALGVLLWVIVVGGLITIGTGLMVYEMVKMGYGNNKYSQEFCEKMGFEKLEEQRCQRNENGTYKEISQWKVKCDFKGCEKVIQQEIKQVN